MHSGTKPCSFKSCLSHVCAQQFGLTNICEMRNEFLNIQMTYMNRRQKKYIFAP